MAKKTEPVATVKRKYVKRKERTEQLTHGAYEVACKGGIVACTRRAVAAHVGMIDSGINRFFPTVAHMHAAVLTTAVQRKNADLLADAAASGYDLAQFALPRQLQRDVKNAAR